MEVLIDDKEFILDVENLERLNGNTKDGKIYRYNDEALKILHSKYMTYDKACYLSNNINTSLFLKPLRIVKDLSGNFIGYTTLYKKEVRSGIGEMTTEEFINGFKELRNGFVELANHGIHALDCGSHNTIIASDNGILKPYICDLDRYLFAEGKTHDERLHISRVFLKEENLLQWKKVYETILKDFFSCNDRVDYLGDYYLEFDLKRYLNFILESKDSFSIISKELNEFDTMNDYLENVKQKVLGR